MTANLSLGVLAMSMAFMSFALAGEGRTTDPALVDFRWGVKIPMRDGVRLNATVYKPRAQQAPAPCIFTLTPYIADRFHAYGLRFATQGYPFLAVDVRGRGNSEGVFRPFIQEARDGHDIVEWLAQQPYCNGKVTMWGGSYGGYDQWATAKEFPPHLATIVPVASPHPAVDFPMRGGIFYVYAMQWLTFTAGNAAQTTLFGDIPFWHENNRRWLESGGPFKALDTQLGNPSDTFQEWLAHPHPDSYWDAFVPSAAQYSRLSIPILSITGSYDGDQPGALAYYREHMKHGSSQSKARHYLVIGPWDHSGTRAPQASFGGLTFGPASLLDMSQLHVDWYAWTMQGGPKPRFLQKNVAYYVMGADIWRYADTLDAVTAESRAYYLDSANGANDVFASGSLGLAAPLGKPDHYYYDPRDVSIAALEVRTDPFSLMDQSVLQARRDKLVYHTAPFERDAEISGFFKLSAWLAIDQPDTDFVVSIYEILRDGSSILLTNDMLRARYRQSLRKPTLVTTRAPQRYDFNGFLFTSRRVAQGSRLRLAITPAHSMQFQTNFNSGGDVASESMKQARPVTVTLHHDEAYPSALYVPFAHPIE